jgi:hypothetical protein
LCFGVVGWVCFVFLSWSQISFVCFCFSVVRSGTTANDQ